ncbi:hypothetical protein M2451_002623 [Dysgonomonas sp. PFB1-18]|uniref:hypothetical protein n=1 Tax=unclassified Dysgonomonas TaxID=2630389 RepID=UPI002476F966|nr:MULTISPECIES: hypothetical protein [unclassified Dysgonomonas]MDH6308104.1 hypothetical protein [Dysgonomonas sp. PF1-14]MDH6339643.1 hypothetical protein [Dysgonomonas sp. PF1-16]MDH6381294.1 hypothetical protein [Dysgonomonas sp. PFB1-18]MDH6398506.1 hypothetical protein [Dysgonomonas sp. PF1-23]
MDKQQLIQKCRYYKGEKENPFTENQNKNMFWFYESKWVEMSLNSSDLFSSYIDEYNAAWLYDFERKDGTPQTLKALLFNRYTHLNGDYSNPPEFKKWYLTTYKGNL